MKILNRRSFSIILSILLFGCSQTDSVLDATPGDVQIITEANENGAHVTFTSIEIFGSVSTDENILSHGICWDLFPNPTIHDHIEEATKTRFSAIAASLTPNTLYYLRVFTETSNNVTYGEELAIKTKSLENTAWKFTNINAETTSTINVIFRDQNVAISDSFGEVEHFEVEGSWSLVGSRLTWDTYFEEDNTRRFEGMIVDDQITGHYTSGINSNHLWTAIPR